MTLIYRVSEAGANIVNNPARNTSSGTYLDDNAYGRRYGRTRGGTWTLICGIMNWTASPGGPAPRNILLPETRKAVPRW